jgi:cellulose synthase/poly-beta-1,6-N-acetylglucosamine synthase-like glycosyltransferase
MILVDIIQILLIVLIGPIILYQLFLGLVAFRSKLIKEFDKNNETTFAIIIPAHNEEKMIAKTIYSINGIIYPHTKYDVFVIADNCSDNTAQISRHLGVNVLERTDTSQRGKGYALRWAFDRLISEYDKYDAFVVIDSDSLISGNYLHVMNHYIKNGSRVIQSSDLVLPQKNNWSSEATRIGFILFNYVKPLGRKYLGFDMGLRGNGMCFTKEVLVKIPWQSWALTEDLEYGLILLLNGERIHFAPEATVWAHMPLKSENARSQRERWEEGRKDITKSYSKIFLKDSFKNRSLAFFDVFIDLITPPFVNTMLIISLLLVASFSLSFIFPATVIYTYIWGVFLLIGFVHLLLGLRLVHADRDLYKSVLYIPIYVIWKVKVIVKTLFSDKPKAWVRTSRES